jgi:hypothetical protein
MLTEAGDEADHGAMNNALRRNCRVIKTVENQMAVIGTLHSPGPDSSQFPQAKEPGPSETWGFGKR